MEPFNFLDRPDKQRIQAIAEDHQYEVDSEAAHLYLELQRVYRETEKTYNRLFEKFNLSESRFTILMFLDRAKDNRLFPSEIAEKLGVKRATASKLLKGMEQQGLVTKSASKTDKRAACIQLTSKGNELLKTFLPYNYEAVNQVLGSFTTEEKEQFSSLLKKWEKGKERFKEMEESIHGNKEN